MQERGVLMLNQCILCDCVKGWLRWLITFYFILKHCKVAFEWWDFSSSTFSSPKMVLDLVILVPVFVFHVTSSFLSYWACM